MPLAQPQTTLSLDEFLARPETEPATEYVNGVASQKSMPKGKHSRLTWRLCSAINAIAEGRRIGSASPELRCTFDGRSIVPDVAVFRWERIPFEDDGEIPDDFLTYPDWIIEILSPGQGPNAVIEKITHCLEQGAKLGWLIDPSDRSVLKFQNQHNPKLCRVNDPLISLSGFDLELTASDLFNWLKM
ncbi:MAG: Uma2 family endonuclease [Cyanophyceae cyanobacterium]